MAPPPIRPSAAKSTSVAARGATPCALTLLAALVPFLTAACRGAGTAPGRADFDAASWDDGMAVVCVYEGRVRRYGTWREAEVRDYMVREYLDPVELTKRDRLAPELVPVLKVNRQVSFETGSYDYRLMSSLSFQRADARLLKGIGTCVNACGLVHQRWDRPSGRLRWDSYWEGEGRADVPLAPGDWRFADELPFVALSLGEGARLRALPPLASPRAACTPRSEERSVDGLPTIKTMWLGIGDQCTDCLLPAGGEEGPAAGSDARAHDAPPFRELVVRREGRRTRFVDAQDGTLALELVHDEQGFLESWVLPGEQEFRRVSLFHGPYWERTAPADRALVGGR